jgi:ATP-dependent protease ClpP protease subunit
MAHGVAAIVLASGLKGERAVGPTAELSLTPIENAEGALADLSRIRCQLARVIAALSGQAPEMVAQHLLVGRSFTSAEAVTYGLADRIEARV